jgi:hypothetical protein
MIVVAYAAREWGLTPAKDWGELRMHHIPFNHSVRFCGTALHILLDLESDIPYHRILLHGFFCCPTRF